MALPAAIVLGAVAAIGVPYAFAEAPDPWGQWAAAGEVAIPIGHLGLNFAWPVFCVVTLLVWAVLGAARQR